MAASKSIEAVYEDGIFKPLEPVKGLPEHERVKLTVELAKESYTAQVEAFVTECDRLAETIEGEFDSVQELRQLREERTRR